MTSFDDKVITMSIFQDLQQIGLNEKEVEIYLALADFGKATAQLLSKKVTMPRATVYLSLETLTRKGLVTRETKASTSLFMANPPASLLLMIKREQEDLKRRAATAERVARELEPVFKGKNFSIPRLKFFEGAESIESMLYNSEDIWYESMMKTDCTWWGFEDASLFLGYRKWFEHMWSKFSEERKTKIRLRIFSNFPVSDSLEKKFPLTKIRSLPDKHDFSSTTWLMGDYLVIFSTNHKPYYGYQIQDPVLAENLRTIFRLLWKE